MGVEDAEDVVDEVALVADVDADYEDVDSDSAEEPELDVSCTETRIDSELALLGRLQQDSGHVIPFWVIFPCIFSCFVPNQAI